ncbi:MAG: aminotransferase class V-fold PLP-dependent enzyme [Ktedonobacterales bacterium]
MRQIESIDSAVARTGATPTGEGATEQMQEAPQEVPATGAERDEPHRDLLLYRDEFPILQRKTYLNSCSLGPLSRRSMAAMSQFQDLWNEHGAQAWYQIWMGELAALRQKFARLIGAQPHEVALAPNVSSALSEIATGLDLGERNKVVLADMDFPTLAYQWLAKQRTGIEVAFVESEDYMTLPVERFARHIDARTGLVATSRVFYLSGYIQDVRTLAETAHEAGALLLVDDYQGTGQIPLDVKAAGIDFLVTGSLKWLMGGPGIAFIYVRDEFIPRLHPTVTGWWGARDQFQFRTTEFEFREDAMRLEAGTPAMAAVYAASAALDIVLEIGVERIRERTRFLADDLVRRVQEHGWQIRSPLDGARRSSIVMLAFERPEELVHGLSERGIVVDSRPGLLRISPSFYNTVEENAATVAALDELLRQR